LGNSIGYIGCRTVATSDLEEGYVKPFIRELINNYRDIGRKFRELSGPAKDLLERISKLVQVIESYQHQLKDVMPNIISIIDELKNKIIVICDKIGKVRAEDLGLTRKIIEGLQVDIDEASKFLRGLDELLRKPTRLYIASKISEYIGLDREKVLELLEGLSEEEILDFKTKIERFIVDTDKYSELREKARMVFSSEVLNTNLNKDVMKELTRYAYNIYELLASCKNVGGLFGVSIAIMFLSRVSNYQALSKLGDYSREIVEQIDSLTKQLSELSKVTGSKEEELLKRLSESVKEDVFIRLDDVVSKLKTIVNGINSFVRLWNNYQKLDKLVKQVEDEHRRIGISLTSYYRKEYEHYLNELGKLREQCLEDISKNLGDVLIRIYKGYRDFKCPEDIGSVLVDRLRSSINGLLDTLHGNKVIVERLCKGSSALELSKHIEELQNSLEELLKDPHKAIEYYRYIIEANNVSIGVLRCVKSDYTKEGLEIDITELDSEAVKALIDVLKTLGKKLVLRAA